MADKKRSRKTQSFGSKSAFRQPVENFDDELEDIRQETLAAVVERETYPRGRNTIEGDDDTQIYYTARERYEKTGRYEQSPDTVAQHMQDRTQFRH